MHSLRCIGVAILMLIAYANVTYGKDPDADRDVVQLIKSRGFQVEIHYVTTEDGYILTVHRIVNPESKTKRKRPVLLQHCFLCSGMDFIINSPGIGNETSSTVFRNKTVGNNLGFALSIFDYDVWLANSRGNAYAVNHTKLNPDKDKDFWNFSFDEMIEFDLPATIKYVLRATNHSTLAYVGHSQGSLIMFGLLASQPKYSKIIKPFIALAPIARLANAKSPIAGIVGNSLLVNYLYNRGGAFLRFRNVFNELGEKGCKLFFLKEVCSTVLFLFVGFNSPQLNQTRLPVYVAHTPSGSSSWNLAHFGQNILEKKFRKFDYGYKKNLEKYGTVIPPVYDLKNINSKHIAVLHSRNDWLSDREDLNFLRKELKGK